MRNSSNEVFVDRVLPFKRSVVILGVLQMTAAIIARGCVIFLCRVVWSLTGLHPSFTRRGVTPHVLTRALRIAKALGDDTDAVLTASWQDIEGGMTATVSRVTLTCRSHKKMSVIIKIVGTSMHSVFIATAFGVLPSEVAALRLLPHVVSDIMPRVFMVKSCELLGMCVIVIEDLGREESHLRSKKSRDPCGATVAEGVMVMTAIGTLHGRTWGDVKMCQNFPTHNTWMENRMADAVKHRVMPSLAGKFIRERAPDLQRALVAFTKAEFFDGWLRKLRGYGLNETVARTKDAGKHYVVNHGDVRLDNAFFDDASKVCHLIDWQVPKAASPVLDICWWLQEYRPDVLTDKALNTLLAAYVASVGSACPLGVSELRSLLPVGIYFGVQALVDILGLAVFSPEQDRDRWDWLTTRILRLDNLLRRFVPR